MIAAMALLLGLSWRTTDFFPLLRVHSFSDTRTSMIGTDSPVISTAILQAYQDDDDNGGDDIALHAWTYSYVTGPLTPRRREGRVGEGLRTSPTPLILFYGRNLNARL